MLERVLVAQAAVDLVEVMVAVVVIVLAVAAAVVVEPMTIR